MAVTSDARTRLLRLGLLVLLALAGFFSRGWAADTNAAAPTVNNDESLRASILLQEQLRQTQMAIEKNRLEAGAQAASNAVLVAERLDLMEKGLAAQRLNDIKGFEQSESHTILLALAVFAGITLVVLIVASYFQWTAMNRLASVAAALPVARPVPMLGMDEGHSPPEKLLARSGSRFLEVMERLEQRILQLESSNTTTHSAPGIGPGNGTAAGDAAKAKALQGGQATARVAADKASLLIGKSQTLMKMNQPEAALAALEEALVVDPDNAEALIKKGTALERLQRLDEAISCFDRAIASDRSTTMAYLYKGALFNRMQRYQESLACYEQALRTNEKSHPADLSVQSE
jgi:tetratricopeptide (TPR) repeat protein